MQRDPEPTSALGRDRPQTAYRRGQFGPSGGGQSIRAPALVLTRRFDQAMFLQGGDRAIERSRSQRHTREPFDIARQRVTVLSTRGQAGQDQHTRVIASTQLPSGSRTTFASGLYHPVGMALDSVGNLFVADNANGSSQGSIYEYHPDGSRVTFAVLDPSDRPADLAFDSGGNLYMADLGGNIYEYQIGILRRYPRTLFGSVPNSAQSLAWDSSGNLFVVDSGNMIYEFTSQAVRTPFASGQTLGETFEYLAVQPPVCCQ